VSPRSTHLSVEIYLHMCSCVRSTSYAPQSADDDRSNSRYYGFRVSRLACHYPLHGYRTSPPLTAPFTCATSSIEHVAPVLCTSEHSTTSRSSLYSHLQIHLLKSWDSGAIKVRNRYFTEFGMEGRSKGTFISKNK
jgi:hypothetical protein